MATYIDSSSQLHQAQASSLALTCPHCQVLAHITPIAVPSFAELSTHRPKYVGIVYRCDACNSPVFLRIAAKSYLPSRIELASQFIEVERAKEKFSYTYLPEPVELLFREALACYSSSTFNAFAAMCRRTMQATFIDLGEAGKLKVFDQLNDVRNMADLDSATFLDIKKVIFGSDADPPPGMPIVEDQMAGVLLEVVKDLLYQVYVRKGRLQQAMMMRKFLSEESLRKIEAAHNDQPA
jgi:hypothetical protein